MQHDNPVGSVPAVKVHLVNPSDSSFGVAVITPRWLFVLAAATPPAFGDPELQIRLEAAAHSSRSPPESGLGVSTHGQSSISIRVQTGLPTELAVLPLCSAVKTRVNTEVTKQKI